MRTIAIGAAVLLLVIGMLTAVATSHERTTLDYAREDAEIAHLEAMAPFNNALGAVLRVGAIVGFVGILVYLGALGAAHVVRVRGERQPDARGLLPVPAAQLVTVAPVALGAYHGARQIEAARQPVPHTVTYAPAPRFDYRGGEAAPVAALPEAAPVAGLPGLTDFAALGFRPSLESILLGLAEGGERIAVPAKALCHVALVGATGGGKSNLLRLLVPQLQSIGARVVLADPHFTPFDQESGEDWRPIAARLHLAPAVAPGEIAGLFDYLTDELGRRLELRRAGQKWGPPLFLAMDELPVIADTVPGSIDTLGRLLREGRKVGLFTVGAAQSFLVKVIGGDSSVREAYRTAFYVGGDLKSATTLLDMPQRDIAEGAVGTGIAYLRSAATSPARLVRVPYASNSAVAGLLGAPSVAPSVAPSGPAPAGRAEGAREGTMEGTSGVLLPRQQQAPEWTAEELRILEALRAGKTPGDVAAALAGVSGGRKYQAAAGRVAETIRRAIAI